MADELLHLESTQLAQSGSPIDGQMSIEVPPDALDVYESFWERGWGDGLPIIPPTPARVEAMLGFTDRDRDEELGVVPPVNGMATVEKIAINAVMAGCRPEYFPVVLACIESALDPVVNLRATLSTTYWSWPCFMVNGPIRRELEINSSWGFFSGSGNRASATIGRAASLVFINVGGAIPGVTEKKPQGTPVRYGICFGEHEERSPWEPLHVERGFDPSTSTVTCFGDYSTPVFIYTHPWGYPTVELAIWAKGISNPTHIMPMFAKRGCEPLLIVNPASAKELAEDGWSKHDVKSYLFEQARNHRDDLIGSPRYDVMPPELRDIYREGRMNMLPRWARAQMEERPELVHNQQIPIVRKPEELIIVVAGGESITGSKLMFFPPHAMGDKAATHAITDRAGKPISSVFDLRR